MSVRIARVTNAKEAARVADTMTQDLHQFGDANALIVRTLRSSALFALVDVWTAHDASRLVGVCIVDRRDGNLSHIYVAANDRRRGIGAQLLQAANKITPLRTVDAEPDAVAFYERCGFTVDPHYSIDDTIRMVRA